MIETEWQTELVGTVNEHGGFGRKLSNRFLVGVPDLLLQVSRFPTQITEVKLAKRVKLTNGNDVIKLEVTGPQARFLTEFDETGGHSSVLSIVEVGTGSKKQVGILFLAWSSVLVRDYRVPFTHHSPFAYRDRRLGLWNELVKYLKLESGHD